MTDREQIIKGLEDYEPYARDLPCVTVKSGLFLDTLELLKEQEKQIDDLQYKLETLTKWKMNEGVLPNESGYRT